MQGWDCFQPQHNTIPRFGIRTWATACTRIPYSFADYGDPDAIYRKPKSNSKTRVNPQESDEFNNGELGLQWQWQANYNPLWGMPTANGTLRLYNADEQPGTGLWQAGNLLLQKLPVPKLTTTAKVRISAKNDGQYAGVAVMGMSYQALVCRRQGNKFELLQISCKNADRQGKETEKVLTTLEPTEPG